MNKWILLLVLATLPGSKASSDTILFESATLGQTGIPFSELTNQNVPVTNIGQFTYAGVRFNLDQPVITSQVGGHLAAAREGTLFGAIVSLADEHDFPDSGDFSTPDFLGSTQLVFPFPSSDEVFGNLSLPLDPGWYALVFGSGKFGAIGGGGALRNNADIGNPTYIIGSPLTPGVWSDYTAIAPNHRFFIRGQIVPEPSSALTFAMSIFLFLTTRRSNLRFDFVHQPRATPTGARRGHANNDFK